MRSSAARAHALKRLVAALRSGVGDEAAARQRYTLGPDAVTRALRAAARRIAEQNPRSAERDAQIAELPATAAHATVAPATPSSMIPV
jgi:hypothetical protein